MSMEMEGFIIKITEVKPIKIAFKMFLFWFFSPHLFSQLYISPNANVTCSANSLVTVNTSLEIGSGAILTQNSSGTIYVSGNWINNGTFNPGSGVVILYTGNSSSIGGLSTTTFYNLHIDKNTSAIVLLNCNGIVQNDLRLLAGTFDLQNYSMNSVIGGTGTFEMADSTMLRIGSTNDLSSTVNNYQNYNIATLSIIHFNGTNQTISNLPSNLTQNFITNTGGLGTVWLSNSGTKVVSQPLLIRGNLVIYSGVSLQNSIGVDALAVRGNVINNAAIYNEGVIEIGICQ